MLAFGVFDHVDHSGAPLREFYENRLKLTELYDQLGFYCYHVAEHHATPLGMASSPSVYLAAVAQRTKRLNFGPLVYTLPLYHPIRLIEEICMLDQMSGGRFQFGVGKGISPIETRYYGVDPENSTRMMIEAFEVLMRGLSTRRLDFAGTFYNFKDVPIEFEPLQKPHPPLWYGTGTLQSVERPAASGMSIVTNAPVAATRELVAHYWRHFRGATQPKIGFTRHLVVADTDEAALTIARRGYRRWFASFIKLWREHGTKTVGVQYPEEFDGAGAEGRMIAGSPQTVLRVLQYILCRLAFGDLSFEESRHSAELFAEQVMPRLRAKERVAAE
jgi:alkanesulfonate monooxygenase SsuD/methylene tetrahydromethanopterin reductase-like flavin-dependent oxidoreductase (luciferase family)